jgi:HAD superfamily hydrolase (TIGR01509 family)
MRSDPQAVLFDMDGTLVDSEKVWTIADEDLARHYGGSLSAAVRSAMVGKNMSVSMGMLHDDIGQPWRDEAYSVRWLEARVKQLFAEGLVWRPGARELLAAVRAAGVRTALVTATARHLVEVALETIGADQFDAVVTADEVTENKPHPMPYLTAARLVGADPTRCVAVEDSPNGVLSAAAAGCAVLAVPCEVELVPEEIDVLPGGRVTIVPSLDGVDLHYLGDLVVAPRLAAGAPRPVPGALRPAPAGGLLGHW